MSSRNSTAAQLTEMNKRWRLLQVALNGDLALFKQLAKEYGNGIQLANMFSSLKDFLGRTVLHLAAGGGNTDICIYLVDEVKLDINIRDGYGYTPLLHAIRTQNLSTIESLIAMGADMYLSQSKGMNSLHIAVCEGNTETITLLISKGADVNSTNGPVTPLQLAASNGNKEMVQALLGHNANPNLAGAELFNPVFTSMLAGSVECLELVLKAGADPNVNPGGTEPLIFAASHGHVKMVECLLKYGADPNLIGFMGHTALESAALENNVEVMKILLPVSARIPSYPNWSIIGIVEHIHLEKLANKAPKGSFLVCKEKGNEAFKSKNYLSATSCYSRAIRLNPSDWTLFSNRSLCWLHLNRGDDALADAIACVKLNPKLPKAYYRKGAAYKLLKNYKEAAEAFKVALQLDPDNKEIDKEYREVVKMVGKE